MDLLLEAVVGFIAGLVGGLLGLGGAIVVVPALILYFSHAGVYTGGTQHLVQAVAMLCNACVAAPATLVHLRAGAMIKPVLRVLIPTSLLGIIAGVALSNSSLFARQNGPYLAMILAGFFLFVAIYNTIRTFGHRDLTAEFDGNRTFPGWKTALCGLPMGLVAGLLGVGGGTVCVSAQQIFLRIPLRRAIANSAMAILCTAVLGAIYKNATLPLHGQSILASLRLAATIVPTAILGGYLGGRLTHALPRKALHAIFIVFMVLIALVTYDKARQALQAEHGPTETQQTEAEHMPFSSPPQSVKSVVPVWPADTAAGHPERSEGSRWSQEILRCAQNDKSRVSERVLKMVVALPRVPLLACPAVFFPGNSLRTAGQASSGTHFETRSQTTMPGFHGTGNHRESVPGPRIRRS